MERKLTKGMFYVFIANMLNMLFNLITNFILPKFLSVDSYAAIKTFQLYVNYVGVFHLGFADDIYLKYGGKNFENITRDDLAVSLSTMRVFQILSSSVVLLSAIVVQDKILMVFSISILPLNVTAYFRMLYQAVGEFKTYSVVTNFTTGLTFIANIILLLFINTDNFMIYLQCYVLVNIIVWAVLEVYFYRITGNKVKLVTFSIYEFKENIKLGFSLMCGNFASFLLTGMDRWFVKFTLNSVAFAQYSFAVSIENMLNLAVTPITIPLYNYFCKEKSKEKLKYIHRAVILFSVILISLAFVAEFVIEWILKDYLSSVKVIFLLFAAQAFQILVKAVYVNLYKVRKQQKCYFIKLIIVIISGFIFNIICFKVIGGIKEAYAWGTFLSSVLWYIISIPDFLELFDGYKDIIFLLFEIAIFIICGFYFKSLIGLLMYSIFSLIFFIIFKSQ